MLLLSACTRAQDCPEGINLLPMYGNATKCKQQLESDKEFLAFCDSAYFSRKEASASHVDFGWMYFYDKDFDTSIKRFNQAWLLDSTNADVYWGFGVILGERKQYEESIEMLESSLEIYPEKERLWFCLAVSYNNLYGKTRDKNYIDILTERLTGAVKANPDNEKIADLLQHAEAMKEVLDNIRDNPE
jgi:tetratricopeptide (TPR) repeat protein